MPHEQLLRIASLGFFKALIGEFGSHLRVIAPAFGVEVQQRGQEIKIVGEKESVERAYAFLQALMRCIEKGTLLRPTVVEQALHLWMADPGVSLVDFLAPPSAHVSSAVVPRTPNQRKYFEILQSSSVVFGVGPAGTGKTFLAVAAAVRALQAGEVKRIILTRPAVEAGEKLGYLPGDLSEKVDPYLRPLMDALHDLLGREKVLRWIEKHTIEIAPLAFMRGRTLQEAFVILDEAQNTTIPQMRMFLTRLGASSRMVITGDPTQIDLPRGVDSGLSHALRVLSSVQGIEQLFFGTEDVVRHPMVAAILSAYEDDLRERQK